MKQMREPLVELVLDYNWYGMYYQDKIPDGMTANEHYAKFGEKEGLFPNQRILKLSNVLSTLDVDWYASEYNDVKKSGINPIFHYIVYGYAEGRQPNKEEAKLSKFRVEGFDADWYSWRYPDVKQRGFEPLEHYLLHGRGEGRAPSQQEAIKIKMERHVPFIKLMHEKLIGREANADEYRFWSDKMFDGMRPEEIAKSIASSREGIAYADMCSMIK